MMRVESIGRFGRRHGQSGFTLIETLLALGLASILTVALLAWLVMAMRVNSSTTKHSADNNASSMLNSYFPSDVANSTRIDVAAAATDCTGGGGQGGTVLAAVSSVPDDGAGGSDGFVVYSVAPNVPPNSNGRQALWRRACHVTERTTTDARVLAPALVAPAGGWLHAVSCDAPCRTVTLSLTGSSGAAITTTASLRVGPAR